MAERITSHAMTPITATTPITIRIIFTCCSEILRLLILFPIPMAFKLVITINVMGVDRYNRSGYESKGNYYPYLNNCVSCNHHYFEGYMMHSLGDYHA